MRQISSEVHIIMYPQLVPKFQEFLKDPIFVVCDTENFSSETPRFWNLIRWFLDKIEKCKWVTNERRGIEMQN